MYVKRHKVRRGGREYVYLRLVEAYPPPAGRCGTAWCTPWAAKTS